MGKSPGRWVKTLIFGKKSSRSKNSKPNYEKKTGVGKEVPVSVDQIENTNLSFSLSQRTEGKTEDDLQSDNSQGEVQTPVPPNQAVSLTATAAELNAQNDSDRNKEEQAATAVQAALRGYLARRAYGTLKGVIRLQALIRGHLVRRQAISTLYCMFRIVKFQAVARGRKIRNSDIGVEVQKRCTQLVTPSVGVNSSIQILKQSSNGFARKILASSPSAMHMHFQYDLNEANSVMSWLDRWSTSHFWKLVPKPKAGNRAKLLKPNSRRFSITNVESIASEFDKPVLNNLRKLSENIVDENPELVLERVKRNLRKVHNPVLENTTVQMETETEKKSRNVNTQIMKSESFELERTPEQVIGMIESETVITKENKKEGENISEEDSIKKEMKKSRRRVSLPVNQKLIENNEPRPIKIKQSVVPSYMAPTESAKAKLRGQDRLDGIETTPTLTRRYSLPSFSNAKSSSLSPRVQRSIQTMGKFKNDRSLQSSRDGNVKVNQVEWRR